MNILFKIIRRGHFIKSDATGHHVEKKYNWIQEGKCTEEARVAIKSNDLKVTQ